MTFATLISCAQLRSLQAAGGALVLLDCSFDLANPGAGLAVYLEGHLPSAQYAHLDHDLCGAKSGHNGRHPLPARADFAARAGAWGIAPGVQVVTFDAQGAPYAARAWWMLRWLGHSAVAVLDGGRQAWLDSAGPLVAQPTVAQVQPSYPELPVGMPTVDAQHLLRAIGRLCVLDARPGERFRGEVEPLDAVAGHIPGASHRFFKDNLDARGRFKPAAELRSAFEDYGRAPADIVHQCGSGVTACHNLLAMAHAGLAGSLLYPGSWSEWCSDAARPVARG